jgi:hypothetical protein
MYFCVETRQEYFDGAEPILGPTIDRMAEVARETGTVLIAPIFESGNLGFPRCPPPSAASAFSSAMTPTFPEAARVLGLDGAEIVFVPTATTGKTRYLWDLELRAHAVTNHLLRLQREQGGCGLRAQPAVPAPVRKA